MPHPFLELSEEAFAKLPKDERKALKASYGNFCAKAKKQAEIIWANAIHPKKLLTKSGESAADGITRVFGYQAEAIAISAILNMVTGSLRIALGVQHIEDVMEFNKLKTEYVPYDAEFHKASIAINGKQCVPMSFDPTYHKLFEFDNAGNIKSELQGDAYAAASKVMSTIRDNGYVPEPSILDSISKDVESLMSKLASSGGSAHADDGLDARAAAGRPVPRPGK